MQNKFKLLISLGLLVTAFFIGANYYNSSQSDKITNLSKGNNSLLQNENSFVYGNKEAKVQLVEFFDPACQTCALFHPYVKEILKQYDGKVKLVLRYAPFHEGSDEAVKILEASKKQGKFLDVLEILFQTQNFWVIHHKVDINKLWQVLEQSKVLDINKLKDELKDPKLDEIVKQDLADAKALNQTKTPGYLVNGKPLAQFGLEQLVNLINSEVKKAY